MSNNRQNSKEEEGLNKNQSTSMGMAMITTMRTAITTTNKKSPVISMSIIAMTADYKYPISILFTV